MGSKLHEGRLVARGTRVRSPRKCLLSIYCVSGLLQMRHRQPLTSRSFCSSGGDGPQADEQSYVTFAPCESRGAGAALR